MSALEAPPDNVDGELSQQYDRLFRFGMDSDLTIKCQDQSWHVHTSIIFPRSKFFAQLCQHQNPQSKSTSPGSTNAMSPPSEQVKPSYKIVLYSSEPWAIEKFLRYFYILTYFTLPSDYARFQFAADLNTDIHLHILAQRYSVDGLSRMTSERYEYSLRAYLVGCQAGSLHQNTSFHPCCSDDYAERGFLMELLAVLEIVYRDGEGCTRVLRECTVGVVRDILARWSRENVYENSMYALLGTYLKRVYEELLGMFLKGAGGDFKMLGTRVEKWRGEYVTSQEEWLRGHRSAWAEDWEVGNS